MRRMWIGGPELSGRNFTPLAILHPAVVIAYTIFTLVIALVERVPLSAAEKTAAISSQAFDLDMTSDDSERPHGEDLKEVRGESKGRGPS